jgi:hypothetical protein
MEGYKNTTLLINTKRWKEFRKIVMENGMRVFYQLDLLLQEFIKKNKGRKNGK